MANTTFSGPVRSENGFQTVSKNATTGAITVTAASGTNASALTEGSGITSGTGTVYKTGIERTGNIVHTQILIDLTGLQGAGTAGDIIGDNLAANCHIGQITTALNGTMVGMAMTCLEAPAGGNADINIYSAVESTGTENDAISGLTSTILINGGAQTAGLTSGATATPAADEYLYLVCGTATDATFTAGQLVIDIYGYDA